MGATLVLQEVWRVLGAHLVGSTTEDAVFLKRNEDNPLHRMQHREQGPGALYRNDGLLPMLQGKLHSDRRHYGGADRGGEEAAEAINSYQAITADHRSFGSPDWRIQIQDELVELPKLGQS